MVYPLSFFVIDLDISIYRKQKHSLASIQEYFVRSVANICISESVYCGFCLSTPFSSIEQNDFPADLNQFHHRNIGNAISQLHCVLGLNMTWKNLCTNTGDYRLCSKNKYNELDVYLLGFRRKIMKESTFVESKKFNWFSVFSVLSTSVSVVKIRSFINSEFVLGHNQVYLVKTGELDLILFSMVNQNLVTYVEKQFHSIYKRFLLFEQLFIDSCFTYFFYYCRTDNFVKLNIILKL